MFKKSKLCTLISCLAFGALAQADLSPETHYQPDSYTKYDLKLEKESINISVFKVDRDEPHLNPLYLDIYFQCGENKSFYKLKREFGEYESEVTYCSSEKPVVEEIDGKNYLSLSLTRATPESGCSAKSNRKEVFSVKEIKDHCSKVASAN